MNRRDREKKGGAVKWDGTKKNTTPVQQQYTQIGGEDSEIPGTV